MVLYPVALICASAQDAERADGECERERLVSNPYAHLPDERSDTLSFAFVSAVRQPPRE